VTLPIAPAPLQWRDNAPFSLAYDDIYFSGHYGNNGIEEVRRVFITPAALQIPLNAQGSITVGELGFGTGLNFLVCADWVLEHPHARLEFVSFEAHPLAPTDWQRLARQRQNDCRLAAALTDQAPPLLSGWHRRMFADGRITLSVFHGELSAGLESLQSSQFRGADSWFLDGFAPDRNPEMWTDTVLKQVGELTQPGGTIATFTAAGRVRRGLAKAGFVMRKVDQRPNKRESLAGRKPANQPLTSTHAKTVQVHGAGIAGATMARHLADAGLLVEVFDPAGIATGGSRIRQAVMHPRLLGDQSATAAYRVSAYHYARGYLKNFDGYRTTGVLLLEPDNPKDAHFEKIVTSYAIESDLQDWVRRCDHEDVSRLTGLSLKQPGLYFPHGATIDLPRLCADLLDHENIRFRAHRSPIDSRIPTILCSAAQVREVETLQWLEVVEVAGQLDELNSKAHLPSIPIVGRGYCVPTAFGCVVGSTYEHTPWLADNALAKNLKMNQDYLPDGYEWRGHQRATRAISSDRNPIVGQVGENLWVSTAHGSMGTTSAAYASAVLTSVLLGLSPTATNHQIELIAPQRFLARQARRGILKR